VTLRDIRGRTVEVYVIFPLAGELMVDMENRGGGKEDGGFMWEVVYINIDIQRPFVSLLPPSSPRRH